MFLSTLDPALMPGGGPAAVFAAVMHILGVGMVLAHAGLALRWTFIKATRRPIMHLFKLQKLQNPEDMVFNLSIELWEGLGALLLQLWSTWVLYNYNGGCTFWDTTTCLEQYSSHPVHVQLELLYCLTMAWYLHISIKHVYNLGANEGLDNLAHHASTLLLLAASYSLGLTRTGLLTLCIFNVTNPLLYLSRACHFLQLKRTKRVVFGAFALAFFVARIVLVPAVLLRSTLKAPKQLQLPTALAITINLLLLVLYALNVLWFTRVVRILLSQRQSDAAGLPKGAKVISARQAAKMVKGAAKDGARAPSKGSSKKR